MNTLQKIFRNARRRFLNNVTIKSTSVLAAAVLTFTNIGNVDNSIESTEKGLTRPAAAVESLANSYEVSQGAHLVIANGRPVMAALDAANDNKLIGCTAQAQAAYDKSRRNEPAITNTMVAIANNTEMMIEGLEHSVKTASSIANKLERKVEGGLASEQATKYVENLHDIVRYTLVGSTETLTQGISSTIATLTKNGYSIIELDNKFLNRNNRYKAVHLTACSPENQLFEVQIHSQEGRQAGLDTHEMYEEWRNPATDQERKAVLFSQIKAIYDSVPIPTNIDDIANIKVAA